MEDFDKLREKAILLAKKNIRESICEDEFIIHAINNIDELAKITNVLTKRLIDWYALYLPEISKKISDHETFVKVILTKKRNELIEEYQLKESMGTELSDKDYEPINNLALKISTLYELRDELKNYLEKVTSSYCKNCYTLAGSLLSAKLIRAGGSLKKLAMMHSSKIQLLGAETALFRHLKTGARPPKHGIILQHTLVGSAKKSERGKRARVFADKIAIAIKTDYFKGEFIGDKLKKDLEEKFK
ncbi:MAG: hypothetical protein KJ583_05210 [Nanoarchaeota archaeon]|nr:hypothetical protein [Nanoarchaeota archaeon]MBU1269580.1 hypothetical protein [Nanoarchaeota archaeon]MBU1604688.1 hypothetical protein [Nanoarchaeota archaeon]MBU2443841.1 hypothetical protein [Nanoarchaeota archaeon]